MIAPPCLQDYDRIAVAFSGGKDSAASLFALFDAGADPRRIELHHHDIDDGETFLDWPITPAYCAAFAAALGLPLYRSRRRGGFLGELDRVARPAQRSSTSGRTGRSGAPAARDRPASAIGSLRSRRTCGSGGAARR